MRSAARIPTAIILGFVLVFTGCASMYSDRKEKIRLKTPRLQPLVESEWDAQQREILSPIKKAGRLLNIYATLARHPVLFQKWTGFGSYVLRQSSLPPRDREILILRIGWLCRAEYEFGRHTLVGKAVGLTEPEILRITKGPEAPGWDPFEAILIRAADELHQDAFITDTTWTALSKRYNEKQLIDLIFTTGQYNLVSMALNTLGIQLEEGVAGFPDTGSN